MFGLGTLVNTGAIVVGGLLIFCVGWNLIHGEKKIRVANLLPSLVFAVACSFFTP